MEYYKQIHDSFEDNINSLDNYSYKYGWNNIEREVLEPHCNCIGTYEAHGLKISRVVEGDSGHLKTTKATEDICDYCGHYVIYRPEQLTGRGHYKRKKQ